MNKKWFVLLLFGLLLIPVNLFVPDASAGSSAPSPSNGSQLGWNETLSQLCVNLSDDEGDGMEYEIRQNSVVLESGGTLVYTNTTHSFIDTVNNSASWESSKGRITSGAAFTGTTEFTVGEYRNVSGWGYCKKLTVDHTLVDSDLVNFPVLFSNISSDFISHAQVDGDDFLFISSDYTIKYNHEIEYYNSTSGELIAWVNVTSLSSTVDTELYLYYGNSDCSSQQNVSGTWDSDYISVWHWNNSFLDSTVNDYDGINENLVDATGLVASGLQNSRDEERSVIVNNFYDSSSDDLLTAEIWIRFDDNDEAYPRIFCKGTTYSNMDWGTYFRGTNGQEHRICVNDSFSVQGGTLPGDYGVGCFGFWFYSWFTINRTDGNARAYYNTTRLFSSSIVEMNITNDFSTLYIGNDEAGESWNGRFDETRVSKIVRSWEWMNVTYNSIYNYDTFLSVGSECSMVGVNTSSCSPTIWSHHNFSFNLSSYVLHNITGLEVRWHGYGGYYTGGAKPKWNWGTTMYFEASGSNWYTADSTTPFTTDDYSPVLEWINYSAHHDMSDWINDNGILNVGVEHTSALDCSVIYTDYIELVVTTIGGGVGNGTYCTSNVSWWNDTCGSLWSWVVYVTDGRGDISTTTYTFSNTPCTFSGTVYPTSGSTDVCPCSSALCVDVTADYSFNMTVYGREQGKKYWHIWNSYTNRTADNYCFCMDTIQPTVRPHAVLHRHTASAVTVINTWYNITFEHGNGSAMDIGTNYIVIPSHGHYTINYWAAVRDDDANPTGHKMAIRVISNDVEVDGSYRELEFTKQGKEQHLLSQVHNEYFEDDVVKFQYIGDDTDQEIATYGTWSDDNICCYVFIEKTGTEENHPLMYNTTYEWYVNVSKFDNSSLYNETSVFSFTTTSDIADCACGEVGVSGGMMRDASGIVGLCGLFAIPITFILYQRLKKRRGSPPSGNQHSGGGYRNY